MRTHLLQLLTAVAAIGVLLFTSVAYAQDDSETPIMTQAECEAAGFVWTGEDWWGLDGPPMCLDRQNETVVGYGVETSPGWVEPYQETAPTQPEAAPVEQAPAELPATQPAPAQQGSPQYTG